MNIVRLCVYQGFNNHVSTPILELSYIMINWGLFPLYRQPPSHWHNSSMTKMARGLEKLLISCHFFQFRRKRTIVRIHCGLLQTRNKLIHRLMLIITEWQEFFIHSVHNKMDLSANEHVWRDKIIFRTRKCSYLHGLQLLHDSSFPG